MNSPTGFDDDDFFGNYDAGKSHAGTSVTPLEFEEDDRPPTREQLAHWGRFRKPVGLVVGAMALLSLVALAKVGSHAAESERPLIAHYGAALAAAPPRAISARIAEPRLRDVPATPDTSSDLLPEELSSFVTEVWSVFAPASPSETSETVPLLVTDETEAPLEPAAPTATPLDFSAPLDDSASAAAFLSAPAPMCWLPAASSAERDSCGCAQAPQPPAAR